MFSLFLSFFLFNFSSASHISLAVIRKGVTAECYSCNLKKSDALFVRYAKEFKPTKIGLDECSLDSFNTFFSQIDINCLRSLPHYKYGVLLVMLKLYDYHILKGHQGYDLYSMKTGAAKIIIDEFELIGGYNQGHYEMLNSGTVLDMMLPINRTDKCVC